MTTKEWVLQAVEVVAGLWSANRAIQHLLRITMVAVVLSKCFPESTADTLVSLHGRMTDQICGLLDNGLHPVCILTVSSASSMINTTYPTPSCFTYATTSYLHFRDSGLSVVV